MKTEWDYTELAEAYVKRPDYAESVIQELVKLGQFTSSSRIADIGAGVAHLSLMLAKYGMRISAVEPNDAMRKIGIKRTNGLENITWSEGVGEATGLEANCYDGVTFGSSFNVCDRCAALHEVRRIAKPGAWFAAMWNHRDLSDPLQAKIEALIRERIPSYNYGTRRESQTEILEESGLFRKVIQLEGQVEHEQSKIDVLTAWKSHGTLQRQAKERFHALIEEIKLLLDSVDSETITVPYTTRAWIAQLKE